MRSDHRDGSVPRSARMVGRLGAIGMAALALALAPASSAQAAWSNPERLATSRVWDYQQLDVALGPSGDAAVAWKREETLEEVFSGVEAATRKPGKPWQHATLDSSRNEGPEEIALGMDGLGRSTLAWLRFFPSSREPQIETLTHRPGARWARPAAISNRRSQPPGARAIALDVGSDGRAALSFDTGAGLGIALRGRDGLWRKWRTISRRGEPGESRVAVLPGGGAAVAWVDSQFSKRASVRVAVVGPLGRPRGPVRTLFTGVAREPDLQLASNSKGSALLVWRTRKGSGGLMAATLEPGGRFGSPQAISAAGDSEPSAAVDTSGDSMVLFTHVLDAHVPVEHSERQTSPTTAQRTVVEETTRPAGGPWAAPHEIGSQNTGSSLAPQVVASPEADTFLATWTAAPSRAVWGVLGTGGGWPPEASLDYSSTRSGLGGWLAPLPFAASAEGGEPAIALNDGGEALAAWVSCEADREVEHPFCWIEASDYTP